MGGPTQPDVGGRGAEVASSATVVVEKAKPALIGVAFVVVSLVRRLLDAVMRLDDELAYLTTEVFVVARRAAPLQGMVREDGDRGLFDLAGCCATASTR